MGVLVAAGGVEVAIEVDVGFEVLEGVAVLDGYEEKSRSPTSVVSAGCIRSEFKVSPRKPGVNTLQAERTITEERITQAYRITVLLERLNFSLMIIPKKGIAMDCF